MSANNASSSINIVCLSDTHGKLDRIQVPDGNILIHAGDFTNYGSTKELLAFADQLRLLPHSHKMLVAGNHDYGMQTAPEIPTILGGITYLQDSGVEVEGLTIYGSPWQPSLPDMAFFRDQQNIASYWQRIPTSTDILITHFPPFGFGDNEHPCWRILGLFSHAFVASRKGCPELLAAVIRVHPRLHIFGHIHQGYGVYTSRQTTFVNASICDERYRPLRLRIRKIGKRILSCAG